MYEPRLTLRLSGNEVLYHSLQWKGWIGELREKGKLAVRVRKPDLPRDGRLRDRDYVLWPSQGRPSP